MPDTDSSPPPARGLVLLVVWSGLAAIALLVGWRSYGGGGFPGLDAALHEVKYVAALCVAVLVLLLLLKSSRLASTLVAAAYLAGLASLLWVAMAPGPLMASARPGCAITSLVIEASGTQYLEPPRFQVLLDGTRVAEFAAPGPESHAATAEASLAEMKDAAGFAQPFTVPLPPDAAPRTIEIRYINDKWGTPDKPGDRNLFIKSVIVNGVAIPEAQLKPDAASHGITDASGTALYENGSLWVMGPLVPGCG